MFPFSITVLMGAWFWFNRKKINYKIFMLSSFKIYLAVFLFLIQVPYEYLMCVGNFVSIAIFCELKPDIKITNTLSAPVSDTIIT